MIMASQKWIWTNIVRTVYSTYLKQRLRYCLFHIQFDSPIPLAHALCVRRPDVLLHDLLPPPPAQPAAEEALDLLDLVQVRVLAGRGHAAVAAAVEAAPGVQAGAAAARAAAAGVHAAGVAAAAAAAAARGVGLGEQPPLLL